VTILASSSKVGTGRNTVGAIALYVYFLSLFSRSLLVFSLQWRREIATPERRHLHPRRELGDASVYVLRHGCYNMPHSGLGVVRLESPLETVQFVSVLLASCCNQQVFAGQCLLNTKGSSIFCHLRSERLQLLSILHGLCMEVLLDEVQCFRRHFFD
jgi:hypothetical protein